MQFSILESFQASVTWLMGTTNLGSTALGRSCLHAITYIAKANHTVDWDICQKGRCIHSSQFAQNAIGPCDLLPMAKASHIKDV